MIENTVLLGLEKYDHLNEFKQKILNGKIYVVNYKDWQGESTYYIDPKEIPKNLKEDIDSLVEEKKELEDKIKEVKKLGYFGLRSWKRKNT